MKFTRTLLILAFLGFLNANAQMFNPVKWHFSSKQLSETEFDLEFKAVIEKGWHIYGRNLPDGGPIPTSFHFETLEGVKLTGQVRDITKPEKKYDPNFMMELELMSNTVIFRQKVTLSKGQTGNVGGFVEYSSCDDERCLPPLEESFNFELKSKPSTQANLPADTNHQAADSISPTLKDTTQNTKEANIPLDESALGNKVDKSASKGSLWAIFLASLLAGFAGLLTPCVYPMIPLTVSFFIRNSGNRAKAVASGLAFGLSIVAIYTSIGLAIALSGSNFANLLSSHWIPNLLFFLLFVMFALSFFGMFEIVLPSSVANRIDQQADKGGLLGPFFMALATVIVSFSCTGPIVGALLIKAAQGQVLEPVVGMFGFSLVFALPFTLFAIFPGMMKKLPKSGGWLTSVKVVLAFLMLAFGLKFLANISQAYHIDLLDRTSFLVLWIAIFAGLFLYLTGIIKVAHDAAEVHLGPLRMMLAIGTLAFTIYLITGLSGNPLQSLSSFLPPVSHPLTVQNTTDTPSATSGLYSQCGSPKYADRFQMPYGLEAYYTLEEGLACARKTGKQVFIDFKGHFCSNCKEMEAKVWSDPRILKALKEKFVIVALYTDDKTRLPENEWVTGGDGKIRKTLGQINLGYQTDTYQTNSIPLYVVADSTGTALRAPRGYNKNIEAFLKFLGE